MFDIIDFFHLNERIKQLINDGTVKPSIGTAKRPIPVVILDMNEHAKRHGVTKKDAQKFIDNAIVMFDQKDRSLYVSREGNAVVLNRELRAISAYGKEKFDYSMKRILEVLLNDS